LSAGGTRPEGRAATRDESEVAVSDESESQENEADEALKQAMEKPEDERTDADWELLAKALEADEGHVAAVAHEVGTDLVE
jgi:hypothetical protein